MKLIGVYRANALFGFHGDDPESELRFLVGEPRANGGMCEQTAWRSRRDNQWWSVCGKKRGTNGKRPGPPVHDDLLQRYLSADDINEDWLSEITEHHIHEGKLYLFAIRDAFSRQVVSHSTNSRVKARLAVNARSSAELRPV